MVPSPSARRGEGLFAESRPRSCATPRVSVERESSLIDLTTSSDVDVDQRLTSRTSLPRQPSPPGDTTSDAEHESDSARRVTLDSSECLLRFQASQREQALAELTRFVAFSLTRTAAPSDRAQRDALLSATTIHELGDALRRRQFAGPDSAAVIADLRTELQVVQQINTSLTRRLDTQSAELADLQGQLKVMTLERDRLLDLSKQSTAFSASLRKSVAELEARVASARAVSDAEIAAASVIPIISSDKFWIAIRRSPLCARPLLTATVPTRPCKGSLPSTSPSYRSRPGCLLTEAVSHFVMLGR
ncbi:unnamed protein product [Phytophthora fragariaefolia]|uniref:Unnamed protein product n=1 Tax=Phytophthora fragariaefolia TaxID=1490495 RepID=A0A9W7D4M4_9STRA|nr:unnamed protein product [Phytophthora fragariaefolia]